ncbi:MAG: DNA polymerase III subunit delta [Candidatus Gracilibacteria bacterium]|nr:DNA polymerase III subunit delta [Candidatus Gracilibacteria bacterium]
MPKSEKETSETTNNNIYLFHGEDSFSSLQNLKHWQKQFAQKYGDETNIEIIEGKKLDPSDFENNLQSMPFLAEKKLIIVKNFLAEANAEAQKKVAESISKTPEFSLIIFYESTTPDKRTSLYQKINKLGTVKEFSTPSPAEVTKQILDKAKKENIKISSSTALYLSTQCSMNLWLVFGELEKLATYANGEEITQKMIDEMVSPTLSSSIFKLTDSIAAKNVKESLRIFRILIDSGEEAGMIFFMIVRHFRILIQARELIEKNETQGEMIKKLKQHPFVVQTSARQAKNFTIPQIENIYKTLLEIDRKVKTGIIKSVAGNTSEFQLAIEKLIINCCK